jgi:beta-N-acetylhexosaminidase
LLLHRRSRQMHVGQLLCGGFQGTTVTPQAYHLIVQHHVSTMILLRKNFSSVLQITKLIKDLQYIAMTQGGHRHPLIFAVDEEGGMMNSLFDPECLTQFPGAMALAATGDTELVYEVLRALAVELKTIGFSMLLGPVLDAVTKMSHQLVGVRSFGTTADKVIAFGRACSKGLQDGGLFTMGKHFPGIGNASVDLLLELPMMADSLDQIRSFNIKPFEKLISEGLMDGISVAGCAVPTISPDEIHACLSPVIINQLLRQELGFDGVVISECLEMDSLLHSVGLGQGVILALYAGCDLVMVCHNLHLQNEAIELMEKALSNGNLDREIVNACLRRIRVLQERLPRWTELFPEGEKSARTEVTLFKDLHPHEWARHQHLSETAYQKSITLVRDFSGDLPITKWLGPTADDNNVLILSPLLNPLYKAEPDGHQPQLYVGEDVFKNFGEMLANHPFNDPKANQKPYNVLHTTYTANGLTALHESLIQNSQVIIVLTSEASRNMYQIGIVKYISILCGANPYSFSGNGNNTRLSKPLIIVATLSPYDFFYNKSIGSTYLCCYDYTDNVLEKLVGVLMGDVQPEGCIPGERKYIAGGRSRKRKMHDQNVNGLSPTSIASCGKRVVKKNLSPKRRWLVDELDLQRDWNALFKLWKNDTNPDTEQPLSYAIDYHEDSFYKVVYYLLRTTDKAQKHFVVRNSSLNILYGVVLTWVHAPDGANKVGSVLYLAVDKAKRLQSIGKNLHASAMRYLIEEQHCNVLTLGSSFPLLNLPNSLKLNDKAMAFFHGVGWDLVPSMQTNRKHIMVLDNLSTWLVPKKIFRELMIVGVRFDICSNPQKLMSLIEKSSQRERPTENPDASTEDSAATLKMDHFQELYTEAIRYSDNHTPDGVKIIIALEPTNQNVIGSVILFNNRSQLAKYFPFIGQAATQGAGDSERLIGAIMAPIIDPSYSNLTEIFKFGLVCSGITFLKSGNSEGIASRVDQCIMIGVDEENGSNISGIKDIGFKEWKHYYDVYESRTDVAANFLPRE